MPTPRRELPDLFQPLALQPQAAPVDTFVRPKVSPLGDLAQSLSGASEVLRQYSAQQAERAKQADIAAAEAEVARRASVSNQHYTEAIADGLIPPGASPWYRYAAREAYGRLEATRLGTRLLGEVDTFLQNGDLNASFEQFVAQHVGEFVPADADPAFQQGFYRHLENQLGNARTAFYARQNQVVEARSLETMTAEMYDGLTNTFAANGADMTGLAMVLQAAARRQLVVNPRAGSAVNQALIKTIGDFAREIEDPAMLDLMDQITLPNGTKLSSQLAAREERQRAIADIASRGRALDAARERQIAQRVDALYEDILTHPDQPINWDAKQAELASYGVDGRDQLDRLRARLETPAASDPQVVQDFTRAILSDDGSLASLKQIADRIGHGLTPEDASRLASLYRTTSRFLADLPKRFADQLTEGARRARQVASEFVGGNAAFLAPNLAQERVKKQDAAEIQFRQEFADYYRAHGGDDALAVRKWVNDWITHYRQGQHNTPAPQSSTTPPPGTRPEPARAQQLYNQVQTDLHDDGQIADSTKAALLTAGVQWPPPPGVSNTLAYLRGQLFPSPSPRP